MDNFFDKLRQLAKLVFGILLSLLSLMALIGLFFYDFNLKAFVKWMSEKYLEWFISQSISGVMQPQIRSWYKSWRGRKNYSRLMEEGRSGIEFKSSGQVMARRVVRVTWV